MISNNTINKIDNKFLHVEKNSKTIFGFWLYLVSDCIIFATMFAVYFVMMHSISNGPTGKEIFQLSVVLIETILLLLTAIFSGLTNIAVYKKNLRCVILSLLINFILGLGFVSLELLEFYHLIIEGYSPNRNGFLSAFFTLIGMHGIHIIFGMLWIIVIIFQTLKFGVTEMIAIRIKCLNLFWHFLDIIWMCIFTFIYLIGVL